VANTLPSEVFYSAWFAPRLKLLGHDCAPFCLGHRIILGALRSPFITGGDASPGDVLLFLRVCSRAVFPFHEFDPGEPDAALLGQLADEGALTEALVAIYTWLDECGSGPRMGVELWEEEGEDAPRSVTAPPALAIAAKLIKSKFAEERVMTMPEGAARWWCAVLGELEGGAAFVTDEEAADMDATLAAAGGRN